jgi:hypothetical protein
MDDTRPELFDLPKRLGKLLKDAGYTARLAILARADGHPLGAYDRKTLGALMRTFDISGPKPGEVVARDAVVRTPDGGVDWSPEAKPVVEAASRTKPMKSTTKRAQSATAAKSGATRKR